MHKYSQSNYDIYNYLKNHHHYIKKILKIFEVLILILNSSSQFKVVFID